MKYLFILGRNIKLSVAEVFAYLERSENSVKDYFLNKNALLVEVENALEGETVKNLGGVLAIGIVINEEKNIKKLVKELDQKEIYMGESNKLNYVIWDFSEECYDDVHVYLKKRFKEEKLKATEKKLRERMDLQEGEKAEIVTSKNIQEQYFVFEIPAKKVLFGKIVQKCDYSEIEKRDMQKPVRREELAISPRMAKILINLSGIKEGRRLLDPFCGIGVILQEALLNDLEVVGIDKDKDAIKGARQNLEWFKFNKNKYKLMNEDSSKLLFNDSVNVLVSEPDLGAMLKKVPTKEKAKQQLKDFEELIIHVLNNLKNKISGKMVFSSPWIRTIEKRKGCNIERILSETNLKLVEGFPIDEFRENQLVGRRIFVLEK